MAPVESAGFCFREGWVEFGADLQRVQRVLVEQISAAGRSLGVEGVLVADNSIPRKCCRG